MFWVSEDSIQPNLFLFVSLEIFLLLIEKLCIILIIRIPIWFITVIFKLNFNDVFTIIYHHQLTYNKNKK